MQSFFIKKFRVVCILIISLFLANNNNSNSSAEILFDSYQVRTTLYSIMTMNSTQRSTAE